MEIEGMALAPWGVLAGGRLRTDAEEKKRKESGEEGRKRGGTWERTPEQVAMSYALEKVAQEVGAKSITSGMLSLAVSQWWFILLFLFTVAISYVMQKTTNVFPIIGGRKVEHLEENLEALDITLSPEQIKFLESHVSFDIGFPITMIVSLKRRYLLLAITHEHDYFLKGDGTQPSYLMNIACHYQKIPKTQPLSAPTL